MTPPPVTIPRWHVAEDEAGSRLDKFLASPDRLGSRSRVVPALMTKTARAKITAGELGAIQSESQLLAGQYQSNTIVAAALLEGAAFFNLVAYIIDGHPASLGLGIGLALVILSMFPSTQRMTNWIEQQTRLISEEKMLKRS